MKKRTQKYESVKMQNSENLKAQKLKSWLSPVSPGDDSGELVAAHEWTWQVGFNKSNPHFENTPDIFPFTVHIQQDNFVKYASKDKG